MPDSPGLEALFVRLYLDRHIMGRLAVDLRGRGYDVLLQRMLRLPNHFTAEAMVENFVHLEQFR